MLHKTVPVAFAVVFIFICSQISGFTQSAAAPMKNPENIKLEYLYINKKIIPEAEKKLVFYRELLPGGKISMAGKVADNTKDPAVEVSIDGKRTWRNTMVQNNTFWYSFESQQGMTYALYIRIIDKSGNTNNVDGTLKDITILDGSLYNAVRNTLNGMIDAYQRRAAGIFMSYVNDSFTGEKVIYDSSVRHDFSTFHDMSIRYSLNSVTPDYKDKVFVSFNFNRSYTDVKMGQRFNDQGSTSMVFVFDNGKLSLYSVQGQPLFGFSR